MSEAPSWSVGQCPWALENQPDGVTYCTQWKALCEPKKCSRKQYAAKERARLLSEYRKFPGNPFQVETKAKAMAARAAGVEDNWAAALPKGHCRWCGGPIWSEKRPGEVNKQRSWHNGRGEEPHCLWRYYLHTRAENQLNHLIHRDGIGCRSCGAPVGRWAWRRAWIKNELGFGYYDDKQAFVQDGPDGPFCSIWWASGLQVDHILALAIVALRIAPEKRWRWFGPMNIQGLCVPCHVVKTKADVVALKAERLNLPPQAPAPGA